MSRTDYVRTIVVHLSFSNSAFLGSDSMLTKWLLFGLKYVYSVFGSSCLCLAHWSKRYRKWHVEMQISLSKM